MKKGFTLIELLAVIIILAVVALIATPIVLDVVNDAKDSAAKSETSMIVSGINNYCAAADMKERLSGTTSICKDGVTKEEVSTMVDLGNAKVNSVTYNGKVTALEIESNGRTVKYNGSTYTIDGEEVDTPEEPTPTYAAYSVGDEVTLSDGTTWVVVKDTIIDESEIKLMATSNVKANLTTETGTEIFTTNWSESNMTYDNYVNDSNVWINSTLKAYLDGAVKTRLEASLGTTISDITIWGVEELTTLGCTVEGNNADGYSAPDCDNTKEWYSKVFQNTYSWTKLHRAGSSNFVWYVSDDGYFFEGGIYDFCSVRPVITISKSVISD